MRSTVRFRRHAALILAMALAPCLSGCGAARRDADVEVARVASPDGAVDAVLTEDNPGATASFVYRIHLVAHGGEWEGGQAAAELYGATRNASAYGVDLHWRDARTLEARYLQARSVDLPGRKVDVGGRAITIVLREGIEDPEAPPGGMAPRD